MKRRYPWFFNGLLTIPHNARVDGGRPQGPRVQTPVVKIPGLPVPLCDLCVLCG
jgi:hypothetical protein